MTKKELIEYAEKYRRTSFLTKEKFAAMCGMTRQSYDNITKGKSEPTPKMLSVLDIEIRENIYKMKST